jgi:hypothetical protein
VLAAVCGRALSWRSTIPDVSVPSLCFEWPALCSFLLCFAIDFRRYHGPLLHEFHHQHSFPVPENSCHHISGRRLNFFDIFGECMCIHYFDCSLISTFTNEIQVSSSVTRMMWMRNSSPSFWYRSKKSQSRSHSLCFVRTHEHFRNPSLRRTSDNAYLACASSSPAPPLATKIKGGYFPNSPRIKLKNERVMDKNSNKTLHSLDYFYLILSEWLNRGRNRRSHEINWPSVRRFCRKNNTEKDDSEDLCLEGMKLLNLFSIRRESVDPSELPQEWSMARFCKRHNMLLSFRQKRNIPINLSNLRLSRSYLVHWLLWIASCLYKF